MMLGQHGAITTEQARKLPPSIVTPSCMAEIRSSVSKSAGEQ